MRVSIVVLGVELVGIELDHRAPPRGGPPGIEAGPGGQFERAAEPPPGPDDAAGYGFGR